MTDLICPCCDKLIEGVQSREPMFRWPDEIAALPAREIGVMAPGADERKAMVSQDVCLLRDVDAELWFLRVVMPFEVSDRAERPFYYGLWVKIAYPVLLDYAKSAAQDIGDPSAPEGQVRLAGTYDAALANDPHAQNARAVRRDQAIARADALELLVSARRRPPPRRVAARRDRSGHWLELASPLRR